MTEQVVFDSVSYTKMEKLTASEIASMKNKIIKQLRIYVPGYLVLTGIAIWILLRGPDILNDFQNVRAPNLQPLNIDDDMRIRFWTVAPYFALFLLLLTTIFLTIYYLRSIHPFLKDIKKGEKMAIFYKSKKTAMPMFNRYYITIPLYHIQQIEINKSDFDDIDETHLLCLEMGAPL